jgi:hypothetical protein
VTRSHRTPGGHRPPGVGPPLFVTPLFTIIFVFVLPATSFGIW